MQRSYARFHSTSSDQLVPSAGVLTELLGQVSKEEGQVCIAVKRGG